MSTTHDPWPIAEEGRCGPWAAFPDENYAAARSLAQALLWAKTGRRLGIARHTESVRASGDDSVCWVPGRRDDGAWVNRRVGMTVAVQLAHQPVRSVHAVSVNGSALPAGTWVLDGGLLYRRDGAWPVVGANEPAPIEVRYTSGIGWPAGTAAAMAEVVCEVLAAMGGGDCRLPSRVQSVARQGVTVTFENVASFLESGLLGLPLADALIMAVNPNRLPSRSRVFSVDLGGS